MLGRRASCWARCACVQEACICAGRWSHEQQEWSRLRVPAAASPATPSRAPPPIPSTPAQPRQGRRARVPYAAGCALIVAVVLIVGSVFVLGLSLVLPALAGPAALATLHLPLAVALAFGILFNYAACIAKRPGPVQPHLEAHAVDGDGRVRRGALADASFCAYCCFYKPAGAHHCSACATCVMGLDHHCWCVWVGGRAAPGRLRSRCRRGQRPCRPLPLPCPAPSPPQITPNVCAR